MFFGPDVYPLLFLVRPLHLGKIKIAFDAWALIEFFSLSLAFIKLDLLIPSGRLADGTVNPGKGAGHLVPNNLIGQGDRHF